MNMDKLTENQKQVILTGIFGDGHISTPEKEGWNSRFKTSCKFRDYLEFKQKLLSPLKSTIKERENNGFKKTSIFTLNTVCHPDIWNFKLDSIENNLNKLNNIGIALWFLDDGSLHKNNKFYNLNTHSFSEEVHKDLLVPFFKNMGLGNPKVLKDKKKDGRQFCYLYFGKYEGAYEISNLIRKLGIESYKYKEWDEEFIKFYENGVIEADSLGIEKIQFLKRKRKSLATSLRHKEGFYKTINIK